MGNKLISFIISIYGHTNKYIYGDYLGTYFWRVDYFMFIEEGSNSISQPIIEPGTGGRATQYHGWNQKAVNSEVDRMVKDDDCANFIKGLFTNLYKKPQNIGASDVEAQTYANGRFNAISQKLSIGAYANKRSALMWSAQKDNTNPDYPNSIASAGWFGTGRVNRGDDYSVETLFLSFFGHKSSASCTRRSSTHCNTQL